MSTLQINDLYSRYQGQFILKGLDLEVERGQITALLGPSGCGKTTLLRAVAGLQPIAQGSIYIDGELHSGEQCFIPSEDRNLGMIFQDYALFPHLNVAENILFGVKGLSQNERKAKLAQMLSLVKLDNLGERFPHELSGGQQQRVSIVRALAYEPRLLLLDEPFSNIDTQVRQALMKEMRDILKHQNVTALFVTHSKDEAFAFADKIALFEDGAIVQHGTAEELYARPKDRFVADFLGEANYLAVEVLDSKSVKTALGVLTTTQALDFAPGYKGELLLRPQQLEVNSDKLGKGKITARRFLGLACHYRILIEGIELDVYSQRTQLNLGESVRLVISPHPLVIFSSTPCQP